MGPKFKPHVGSNALAQWLPQDTAETDTVTGYLAKARGRLIHVFNLAT